MISRQIRSIASVAAVMLLSACALPTVEPQGTTGSLNSASTTKTAPANTASTSRNGDANRVEPGRTAKIALLLPLSATGQMAAIAKGMKQAGELALFDSGSATLQLIVKDDLGTPEGAAIAAEDAIKDGAELIIGPLFAGSVKAVAPIAQRANVPVVAFSNDAQVAGRGVYLVSFLVTQDIERIVAYTVAQGRKRFVALLADDAYGRLMGEAFSRAVAAHGGTVKATEFYPPQANAMLEPTRRLVEATKRASEDGEPVEAVFIPGSADALSSLGPLLTYAGLDPTRVKLIGTGAWDYPGIGREAVFVGGWFPAPEPRGWQDFSEKFGKTFGSAPPRIATLSYDAVTFAVQLSTNPPGARFTPGTLTQSTGFNGADGPLRLRADGMADRGLAVLEVQKQGTHVVDPAPTNLGTSLVSSTGTRPVN